MSKISVTFTGADNRTLCDDLTTIIDAARDLAVPVEFGLLCSTKRAGDERYPGGFAARGKPDPALARHRFRGYVRPTCAGHNYGRLLAGNRKF